MPKNANKLCAQASVSALIWGRRDFCEGSWRMPARPPASPTTSIPCVVHPWVMNMGTMLCPLCGMGL